MERLRFCRQNNNMFPHHQPRQAEPDDYANSPAELQLRKKEYHEFLNKPSARNLEAGKLCDYLRAGGVLDEHEAEYVRSQPTLRLRQYCLFLKVLPKKCGAAVVEVRGAVCDGLRKCGYVRAAEDLDLEYHVEKSPGGIIIPRVAQQFYTAAPARHYHTPLAAVVGPTDPYMRGGGTPPPPPPAGWVLPPPVQARNAHAEMVVEEPLVVARVSTGLGAPPPQTRHLRAASSGYGSDTFLEGGGPGYPSPVTVPEEEEAKKLAVEEGSIPAKDLQLGTEIGRGHFAIVHVAEYRARKVAVKVFREYDQFTLDMFLEEVKIMKDLDHRNVVRYIGFAHSSSDRLLWLVSEYIPGGSMRRFCTPARGRDRVDVSLPLVDKARIALDSWRGLDYIHGKSLCHKDISPANILVSNDLTQVKISDFGLAEFKEVIMTAATEISGTPMYYPPEFASENSVTRHPSKSDVYSMGASLCELFSEQWFWHDGGTGQPRHHFQAMFMLAEMRTAWVRDKVVKYPDCWPRVPLPVQLVLAQAVTPDYKARKSARELVQASQELLRQFGH